MKFFDPRGDIEKTAHKLPHWQQGEVAIFVTFRLADSLPRELLDDWLRAREAFLAANPPPWDNINELPHQPIAGSCPVELSNP